MFYSGLLPLSDTVSNGVFFDVEADFGLGRSRRWGHELADGFKEGTDGGIVAFDPLLQFNQFSREFDMAGKHLAELNEGAHDSDVDLYRSAAAEDAGQHGDSLFSEGEGQSTRSAPT
jgi:hypothetical protein